MAIIYFKNEQGQKIVVEVTEEVAKNYKECLKIYFKGENVLQGGSGKNGENGSPAIDCECRGVELISWHGGNLKLFGGNGGAGSTSVNGGNGAPALIVPLQLSIYRRSHENNNVNPEIRFPIDGIEFMSDDKINNLDCANLNFIGGNGGDAKGRKNGGNGGNAIQVNGIYAEEDQTQNSFINFFTKNATVYIKGGNGGNAVVSLSGGNGGNGGNGIDCTGRRHIYFDTYNLWSVAGNGGDSGTYVTNTSVSCGGYGIYAPNCHFAINGRMLAWGGNAGAHAACGIDGGTGLQCDKIYVLSESFDAVGGNGSSSDKEENCGNGGVPAKFNGWGFYYSKYKSFIQGGNGGANTGSSGNGGKGYRIQPSDQYGYMYYINGEDWIRSEQ